MKRNLTPIASGVALLLMGAAMSVQAQEAGQAQTVTVTGIRASLQQSINQKKNADSHVEVVTAEDIGKMPDKNVADSLSRVPGVTISSAGATEGGFDENDRVSMRGTSPSLTQTLINGHSVSSGDWFVLNQAGSQVGRSVSYSLLPSELVSSVVVQKGSEARFIEGGTVGNVDIITRRPLDPAFKKQLTASVSIGAVYADLPKKTDPQLSGLINWKNDSNTFGVLVQVFSEERHLRREGQEILGYTEVGPGSFLGTAHPDLVGKAFPTMIGSTLFEQERKRKGGVIDLQFKPSTDLSFGLNGYSSKMDAPNYNRNYLYRVDWASSASPFGDSSILVAPSSYTTAGSVITSMTTPAGTKPRGEYDMIYRPDESSSSNYFTGDFKWRSDALRLSGQLGQSVGKSNTPTQSVFQSDFGVGVASSYTLHGLGSAADWSFTNADGTNAVHNTPNNAQNAGLDWLWGDQHIAVKDTDQWAQLDADFNVNKGLLSSVQSGVRFASHKKENTDVAVGQRPGCAGAPNNDPFGTFTCTASIWDNTQWPAFDTFTLGNDLGGNYPRNIYYYTPDSLTAFDQKFRYIGVDNGNGNDREDWGQESGLKEKRYAAYVEGKLSGESWSGNLGVRFVHTQERVTQNYSVAATNPAAVNTATAFGAFAQREISNSYNDVLPSLNMKFDLAKDLIARFGVSKTMTLPDYGSLASAIATGISPILDASGNTISPGTGSGGNPLLKPVRSNNFDLSVEYYYAPRSLVSVSTFVNDMESYVGFGSATQQLQFSNAQFPNGVPATYNLTVPVNVGASVHGVELAWEAPLFGGFGANANWTYADGRQDDGNDLNGNSKHVWNAGVYYEDDRFNARLQYNSRSEFFSGIDRSAAYYQDKVGVLSASLGFKLNEAISFSLDGMNLNNPTLKYYTQYKDRPRAFYKNGSQYYLTMHANF